MHKRHNDQGISSVTMATRMWKLTSWFATDQIICTFPITIDKIGKLINCLAAIPLIPATFCLSYGFSCLSAEGRRTKSACKDIHNEASAIVLIVFGFLFLIPVVVSRVMICQKRQIYPLGQASRFTADVDVVECADCDCCWYQVSLIFTSNIKDNTNKYRRIIGQSREVVIIYRSWFDCLLRQRSHMSQIASR